MEKADYSKVNYIKFGEMYAYDTICLLNMDCGAVRWAILSKPSYLLLCRCLYWLSRANSKIATFMEKQSTVFFAHKNLTLILLIMDSINIWRCFFRREYQRMSDNKILHGSFIIDEFQTLCMCFALFNSHTGVQNFDLCVGCIWLIIL